MVMSSGWPSQSRARSSVLRPEARVRIAERRWVFPVEYSIRPPGSSTNGRESANATQSRLDTQRP